jgi:hypothetical protein
MITEEKKEAEDKVLLEIREEINSIQRQKTLTKRRYQDMTVFLSKL